MGNSKSLVRHILTALGAILSVLGLMEIMQFINLVEGDLDTIYSTVEILIGLILKYVGFFGKVKAAERID